MRLFDLSYHIFVFSNLLFVSVPGILKTENRGIEKSLEKNENEKY